ncbi:hypothetical protein BH09SUM1_BH09SUM1_34060 [soil metagenome]
MNAILAALRPGWWRLQRALRPGGRSIRLNGRVTFAADPAVNAAGQNLTYEKPFFDAFLDEVRGECCVFDVGANQGLFAVAAALHNPRARVHAFEAAPAAFIVLKRQVRLNRLEGRVRMVHALIGARSGGFAPFHAAESAVGWASAAYAPPGTRTIRMPVISLDEYAERNDAIPNVIKIDVEGYELEVLKGARRILRDNAAVIFLAVHHSFLATLGQSSGELAKLIHAQGYRIARVDGSDAQDFGDADGEFILRPDKSR